MASKTACFCTDCKEDCSCNKIDLKCHQHYICEKCLTKRATSQPQDVISCVLCSKPREVDPSYTYKDAVLSKIPNEEEERVEILNEPLEKDLSSSHLPIWIFVDDSNLWIEAKKLQGKIKGFKTSEDHRVRIDIGKLADVVANGRPVVQGKLYGSEPPPVDSVWEKIRQKGWIVDSQRRSRITGKEKQVDTQLVADVTRIAIKTPSDERSTIVLVTGDADVIPALDEILVEEHWTAEIYMWKQGLAKKLMQYATDCEGRVKVEYLDTYLTKVTFTSMKFPISSNKELKSKVKESGVVFSMKPEAFHKRIPDWTWYTQLESITQWPFQYYWFEVSGNVTDNLVVVFGDDKKGLKFNIAHFLETVRTELTETDGERKHYLLKVEKVETFLEFISKKYKKEPENAALKQVGVYEPDDVCDGPTNCISVNDREYSTVKFSNPKRQKFSDMCIYKFNCYHGTRCEYKHTEEQKKYFKLRSEGRGNPSRKTKPCTLAKAHEKEECDYAHGENDAWCLTCCSVGHFAENCPK